MSQFNEHWDGVQRKQELTEATQTTIGKYRFTPFTEGSIKGWTISIQGTGQVGYIQEPAKKNTKTTFSPYKVYRTKGATSPWELKMSALPGTENRIVSEKEIRFAPRQLLKAIAMWMDKHGKVMTEEAATRKEDLQVAPGAQQSLGESIGTPMRHFTEMDKAAKQLMEIVKSMRSPRSGGYTKQQSDILDIVNELHTEHKRMQSFFDGLIMNLEGIDSMLMKPSKHGNMEIMRALSTVIRELKKYKK